MFFWPESGRRAWMSQSWKTAAALPKMKSTVPAIKQFMKN